PPILPLFVVGFLAAAALRSSGTIPTPLLGHIKLTEQLLLAAAMVGLGSGVQLRRLRRIGHRPLLLGLASWGFIAAIALIGTTIVRLAPPDHATLIPPRRLHDHHRDPRLVERLRHLRPELRRRALRRVGRA